MVIGSGLDAEDGSSGSYTCRLKTGARLYIRGILIASHAEATHEIFFLDCNFPLTTFGGAFRRGRGRATRCACAARRWATRSAISSGGFERHHRALCRTRAILRDRRGGAYIVGMQNERQLKTLSDDELLRRLSKLMCQSRRVEADLVAHIAEVDARRLYAREAMPSMHAYCIEVLRLTDFEAYLRITAARAAREYPMLLTMLRDGRLHLTAVARLASHLNRDNWETVLNRAAHRSKREIEELIVELEPKPDIPATIRKLPARRARTPKPVPQLVPERVATPSPHLPPAEVTPLTGPGPAEAGASSVAPPARRAKVEPLAPARYKVQFTASAELRDRLERLQALMRSSVPDGDLATIIDQAVTERLERLEARRFAKT